VGIFVSDSGNQDYGTSLHYCDEILMLQIRVISPTTIVDFGAGAGKIAQIAKEALENGYEITAVEGCKDTATMLGKTCLYNAVHNCLI